METAKLITEIENVKNVTEANVWEKGEMNRIYINFKSQNRFDATGSAKVYVDLNTNTLVHDVTKKECAGAATFKNVMAAIEDIEELI